MTIANTAAPMAASLAAWTRFRYRLRRAKPPSVTARGCLRVLTVAARGGRAAGAGGAPWGFAGTRISPDIAHSVAGCWNGRWMMPYGSVVVGSGSGAGTATSCVTRGGSMSITGGETVVASPPALARARPTWTAAMFGGRAAGS